MINWTDAEYTLYFAPFSLYSMMARHTIYLGLTTDSAKPPPHINLAFIHHLKNENLSEDYLTRVNPKGQVPTMTGNLLDRPLTDSLSISLHLAEKHYPALLPAQYAPAITNLLQRFHAIPGLSINNKKPTAEMTQRNPSPVEEILKRTDLSPAYRKALETKLSFHNKINAVAFQPAVVAKSLDDLQAILAEIAEHRRQSGASKNDAEWTFGSHVGPTVLDSHFLPVVLRCMEVGYAKYVPDELQRWAVVLEKSATWQKVMHGRPTKYDPSMGPIEEMEDMMSL
ncbi:hypothetical protein M426DRAFT_26284 [Hypoxylon sp. CI-4A]|nr:hypothetical protein M426DRAFT_26284 [Hypoxylon sp. CI-4A]